MPLTAERIEKGKLRVGASEIGALILGDDGAPIHPYLTPLTLFERKMGAEDDIVKRHLDWGLALEQPMIKDFAQANGYQQHGPAGLTMISSRFKNLLATPDDILERESSLFPVDAKNVQQHNRHIAEWGKPGTDEAPLLYVAQVAIQIEIAREVMADKPIASLGFLVASLAGAPPEGWCFSRDEELVGQMDDLAAKFVADCLVPGRPPNKWWMDPAASDYVKRRFREANGTMLPADAALRAIGAEVTRLRKLHKEFKTQKEAAEALLQSQIGNALGIEGVAKWIVIKDSKETFTNWEQVARDIAKELVPKAHWEKLGDIKERHTAERIKRKGYRRLYMSGEKEE
jgi:hypothetical protein